MSEGNFKLTNGERLELINVHNLRGDIIIKNEGGVAVVSIPPEKETREECVTREYFKNMDSFQREFFGYPNPLFKDLQFVKENHHCPDFPFIWGEEIKPNREKPKTFTGTLTFKSINDSLKKMGDALKGVKDPYEGCVPEIAEALKKGDHLLFRCWDTTESRFSDLPVIAYVKGATYPYVCFDIDEDEEEAFMNAKLIPVVKTETRFLCPSAMYRALIEKGCTCKDDGKGNWIDANGEQIWDHRSWAFCGKSIVGANSYKPWMVEEVEIK